MRVLVLAAASISLLTWVPAAGSVELPPTPVPQHIPSPRAGTSSLMPREASSRSLAAASPEWLDEINRYREAAGVTPVDEEPAWRPGIENHLTYLENTPAEYFIGPYVSFHTENPNSPYYTENGALEAGYSDLTEGGGGSEVAAIDSWWTAPFHAIGMLRPQLARVALGDHAGSGDAGLDVIQGIDNGRAKATSPVLFPGPGLTTNLVEFNGGEAPTPLETCGWQGDGSVGLPIIMLLPEAPDLNLTASLLGPAGATESSSNGQLCVVDEYTYYSSDPIYGEDGREILAGDHAVLMIPRNPLSNGQYQAQVQQAGREDIGWSFEVHAARPAAGAGEPGLDAGIPEISEVRGYTTSNISPSSTRDATGQALRLLLTLRGSRASLHAPQWLPRGLPFRASAYRQVLVCRHRHSRCFWHTISFASRLRYTAGSTTTFQIPRSVRGARVRVLIAMLPFTLGEWSYPSVKQAATEY
jgi:hypothetical protein